MKKFFAIILAMVLSISISGCGEFSDDILSSSITETECSHHWINATCEAPTTCELCGETAGEPLGHHWTDADCLNPQTCIICGGTKGEPVGHIWEDATCEKAQTCKVCGAKEGDPLGHDWKKATYENPKTCSRCGKTEGEALSRQTTPPVQTPQATEKRCLICNRNVKRRDTNYCESHDCQKTGCPYPAKSVPGSYGIFCEFHSCADPKCTKEPNNYSRFCNVHVPK